MNDCFYCLQSFRHQLLGRTLSELPTARAVGPDSGSTQGSMRNLPPMWVGGH